MQISVFSWDLIINNLKLIIIVKRKLTLLFMKSPIALLFIRSLIRSLIFLLFSLFLLEVKRKTYVERRVLENGDQRNRVSNCCFNHLY